MSRSRFCLAGKQFHGQCKDPNCDCDCPHPARRLQIPMSRPGDDMDPARRSDMATQLLHLLGHGFDEARGGPALAEDLGVSHGAIGSLVTDLRNSGVLVGSSHRGGYYIIETEAELESTLEHILARIPGLLHTERVLRASWADRGRQAS